jgi:hypothetical protein
MVGSILSVCATLGPNLAEEPATFDFKRKSGPAQGHKEAFDVRTQAYLHHCISWVRHLQLRMCPGSLEHLLLQRCGSLLLLT